jgi:hypothetical protein
MKYTISVLKNGGRMESENPFRKDVIIKGLM